ncbi:MAG: ABC transporter permease, partial [Planctomycetaceae bacterium]|nr:ABC transporter permease [Planctomycetaceae bacterium]
LFAKEKEDKTDHFLRNMPISGNVVLVGKLLWLFGSMAALVVVFSIVTFVWWMILGSSYVTREQFWLNFYGIVAYWLCGICNGIFWSSITRKQLHAIVGTLASMVLLGLTAVGIVLLVNYFTLNRIWESQYLNEIIFSVYIFLCLTIGAIGLRNSSKWLRKREDKTLGAKIDAVQDFQWRHKDISIAQLRAQKQPHGEFRWLLWHCWRQSSLLFTMGRVLALLLILWPILVCNLSDKWRDGFIVTPAFLFCIAGYIILCNIFYPDHHKNGIMVLSHRGISPGKVWWSRIVMFGGMFAIWMVALFGMQFINVQLDRPIQGFDYDNIFGFVMFYLFTFCVGQFASVISRSLILPMCYTAIFLFLGFWWSMYVLVVNDMGTPLTTMMFYDLWFSFHFGLIVLIFLPVVLSFFVASRLRMADLMRDRPLRASLRKLFFTFGGALVLSTTLLAIVRLSTVPTANLGYHLDPWVLKQKIDYRANGEEYTKLSGLIWTLHEKDNIADYEEVWRASHTLLENPLKSSLAFSNDGRIYNAILIRAKNDDVSPEFLRDAIAFLERAPQERVPAMVQVQRSSEQKIHMIKSGKPIWTIEDIENVSESDKNSRIIYDRMMTLFRFLAPWEKTRALKFAEYRFQTESLLAEQVERLIYHNEGDPQYLAEKIKSMRSETSNRFLDWNFSQLTYMTIDLVTPYSLYLQEQTRRTALLTAALRLWYIEHGELPATLDELEGVYVKEVPLVPFYNKPFVYVPKPSREDEFIHTRGWSGMPAFSSAGPREVPHTAGVPYLATSLDDSFPTDYALVNNTQTFVYDLTFAREGIGKRE